MREEVKVAAKWWTDQLRNVPDHKSGSEKIDVLMMIETSKLAPIPEEQCLKFEEALIASISEYLEGAPWLEDEPMYGGISRVVYTDYGPDKVLARALSVISEGGNSIRLPIKTVMWIDPGKVKVRCGYGAKEEVIWVAEEA